MQIVQVNKWMINYINKDKYNGLKINDSIFM